ncbi:MAG: hypothetical protein EOO38_32190, partial [Cytophagaceae bacterium]
MAYAWRSAGHGISCGSLAMSGLVRLTFHVTIAAGIWRELARQDCQIDWEDFVAWVITGRDAVLPGSAGGAVQQVSRAGAQDTGRPPPASRFRPTKAQHAVGDEGEAD